MNAVLAETSLRIARPCDAGSIRDVLIAAFGGKPEADLVERLRDDGDLVLALVAECGGEIAGYVAFPRLVLEIDRGAIPVCGLAPLAVAPFRQRRGIGTQLVRTGIAMLRDRAEGLIFVLGDQSYYARFGFSAESARGFASPYDGSHFHALRLSRFAPRSGKIRYPRAFASL